MSADNSPASCRAIPDSTVRQNGLLEVYAVLCRFVAIKALNARHAPCRQIPLKTSVRHLAILPPLFEVLVGEHRPGGEHRHHDADGKGRPSGNGVGRKSQ